MPTPRMTHLAMAAVVVAFACAPACAPAPPAPTEIGASVAIHVAPLALSDVTEAVYALTVTNGPAGTGDIVFTRTLESTRFGDDRGSLSFVGPCDASTSVNTVTLAIVALYTDDGPLPSDAFVDPTPVHREFACLADADVAVTFDITLARRAQQGFFDVAISFSDVFCSAKLDCEERETSADLTLLHDGDGARAMTVVLGLACTASPSGDTWLYLDDPTIACAGFTTGVRVDASGLGNVPLGSPPSANADGYLFGAAVYRGAAGAGQIAYWNVALGLAQHRFADAGPCTLRARATASTAPFPQTPLGFSPPEGAVYPALHWEVALSDAAGRVCTRHEVDVPQSGVATRYLGEPATLDASAPLQHRLDATTGAVLSATGGVCDPACARGSCTVDDVCDCTGTSYTGPTCEVPVCTPECEHGGICVAPDACDCTDTGYTGLICELDLDECAGEGGGHDCDPNATCANLPGGFDCTCDPGYTGDGVTCEDVDECATDHGGCSADAECDNTLGGHECTCKPGFVGDGVDCVWPITITTSTVDYHLFAAAGSPSDPHAYLVTVAPGVTVSASGTANAAFRTGPLPAGSVVTLVNQGDIRGAGGKGGSAGDSNYSVSVGFPGGDAVHTSVPLDIDNADGTLFGGGGGGGGGALCTRSNVLACGGSGGGGRGQGGGAAGNKGVCFSGANYPNGSSGGAGTASGPGGGGGGNQSGYYPNQFSAPWYCFSAAGGGGGGWGEPGVASGPSYLDGAVYSAGRAGGAAGHAVRLAAGGSVTFLAGDTPDRVKGPVE